MVELKNIKRNDDIISCDYYPEGSIEKGNIIVDIKTKKVIEHKEANWYAVNSYANHARQGLLEICEKTTVPEEYTVMWY